MYDHPLDVIGTNYLHELLDIIESNDDGKMARLKNLIRDRLKVLECEDEPIKETPSLK